MLFFYFCTNYPGEGKDHFQAKPCHSIYPRESLDRTCVWEARVRISYVPLYVVFVYLWSVES